MNIVKKVQGFCKRNSETPGQWATRITTRPLSCEPNHNEEHNMNVTEELLDIVAGTGRWQFLITFLLSFTLLSLPMNTHAIIFYAPHHLTYWCSWPRNMGYDNWTVKKWLNLSQPVNSWWLKDDDHFESCYLYDLDYNNYSSSIENKFPDRSNLTLSRCQSFNYSDSYGTTIIQKWALVCEHKKYVVISEVVFHIGLMVGNITFGLLSDRFGRKKLLFIGIGLQPIFGIITATSNTMPIYITTRFFFGISLGGSDYIGYIIVTEIVGNHMRTVVCGVFFIQRAFALVYLPLIAYLFQHWQNLQLAISIPNALFLVFIRFIPESPQWLLITQQQVRAANIFHKAANFNGQNIPSTFRLYRLQVTGESPGRHTLFSILNHTNLLKITLILMGLWTGLIFCYSLIILYLSYLGHNIYYTLIVAGGLQLVAFSTAIPCMYKFGHRCTIIISIVICELFLCLIFFLSDMGSYSIKHPVVIVLLCSMFLCAVTMATLWNYSACMFPTEVRSQAFGMVTLFGNLSSLIALVYLNEEVKVSDISVIILIVVCMVISILAWGLTECRNRELPDTMLDADNYKQKVKPKRWIRAPILSLSDEEEVLRIIEFDSDNEDDT